MRMKLDDIKADDGVQQRVSLDDDRLNEYTEKLERGVEFEPLEVFDDGETNWLADGFHRYYAHRRHGSKSVEVNVHKGSRRDAILFAVGANDAHGLPRSNADKRKAVLTLLEDEEWGKWSANKIAEKCAVSTKFVCNLRSSIFEPYKDAPRTCERKGTTYEVDTSNIGRRKAEVVEVRNKETGEGFPADEAVIVKEHPVVREPATTKRTASKTQVKVMELVDHALDLVSRPAIQVSPIELRKTLKELRSELERIFE